ncbi:PA domain-containing protein [Dyadobacter jejuensis]|uniref:PA domain-containing protein n=1 Tax=Dyadobacter jejuensis TaxID=1082580 RepID=A0A316AFL2_9BACT|nr:M28 family peptidase [Dyadobacter jejuensis]PWJ56575.1 PA domain-containing protein [Dyadobacter jejuensis]
MKLQSFALAAFTALLISQPVAAQKRKKTELPETIITQAETASHMRFLASDELQGRRTGEQGNRVAARYIAEQYRRLGIVPVTGIDADAPNAYFQEVAFEKLGRNGSGEILAQADRFVSGKDWILMSGEAADLEAPLVYAGFGLENQDKGWNDYKGIDVAGKIVLVQSGTPDVQTPSEIIASSTEKRNLAIAKGAIGVIELFDAPMPWNIVLNYFSGEKIALAQSQNKDSKVIPHAWINGKEANIVRSLRGVENIRFKTSGRQRQLISSANVVGHIPGTDPILKDEYVLLSAHYDHVGVGQQGGQAYSPEDSIFNGARDNAFGSVALLTAAQALSQHPPKRSVLVVALTGEEIGLLGSQYYSAHPLLPLNKCIFNLNSDGAGYSDTTIVAVMGLDRTGAKKEIMKAAKTFGLGVFADPSPEQGLFDRSDNVSFAKKGIPAPTFSPGFTSFSGDIMKYYHQAIDNPESINFDYLHRFSQAFSLAARLIADKETAPFWSEGDKYEKAGNALYGK